ncbi:MAG: FliI/YscN family ATPase [Chthoniobacteraceae bacterium]|nr:FliI/YscN family ATPase [Chthoniobacteraceae bacterium]
MSAQADFASPRLAELGERFLRRLKSVSLIERIGRVAQVNGLVIESDGPAAALGDVCRIESPRGGAELYAEVVGFRDHRILLMPLGDLRHLHAGAKVFVSATASAMPVGEGLIGRVIDGLGRPLDGHGPLDAEWTAHLDNSAPNPLRRQRINQAFQTGIKAIDVFTPMGCGQRMGIFAGSGVGKSTLLGMMARGAESEVNVIALVGERGRELREFLEKDLGEEGMARSVVVCSTSEAPALVRLRAALLATTIAEHFREQGRKVLFMMDSVTRFAMAQREIGLAIGEPPSSRGYTPSVFALLPRLLERTGAGETGSITAFYTVLVEGDDMNEPIADAVRGILDGHIVLSRALATANHFPAIDVLESVSRLVREVSAPGEVDRVSNARDLLALYRKNEDLVNIGAYTKGTNARIDLAIEKHEALNRFLRQKPEEKIARAQSFAQIAALLQ